MTNAIQIGIAVSASEKLWIVSASNATEPDTNATTSWATAVTRSTPMLIATVRIPVELDSIASSTLSAESWLCGVRACGTNDLRRDRGWS
ncbi:hypothetical protein GCM10007298_17520 [Williamsia phyllosphaerae]|uniref:Uncharacterized protein n=1 Tax=Williamsia phyllosphaerae TaxID=885042 RepID=A0ABQ1ULP9_9NOCA|nr:hypothetical protein GCM10007298_17520 [Williamsia phyllosphaerae]